MIKAFDHIIGGSIACVLPSPVAQQKAALKRILIIRPGGIGDAVFLLPFLRKLKEMGVLVDILCEQRNIGVFLSQEELARDIFSYNRWQDIRAVSGREYDAAIDTEQWHYLSAILGYWIKAPLKAGFATRPLRARLFNVCLSYDQGFEIENFRRLFDAIFPGSFSGAFALEGSFSISPSAVAWAKEEIEGKTARPVVLFLGASIPERRLSVEQWGVIVHGLSAQGRTPLLIGGKDARSLSLKLEKDPENKAVSYVGKLSIERSAALIACAGEFVGADSGFLHIAAAVGASTIGIFGPGNAEKWAPRGGKHKVVSLGLPCSPCTLFGYTLLTCRCKMPCMNNLPIKGFFNARP